MPLPKSGPHPLFQTSNYGRLFAKKMEERPPTPPLPTPFVYSPAADPWSPPSKYHEPHSGIVENPKNQRVVEPLLTQQVWRRRTMPPQLLTPRSAAAGKSDPNASPVSPSTSPHRRKDGKLPLNIEKSVAPWAVSSPTFDPWSPGAFPLHYDAPDANPKLARVQEPLLTSQVWRKRTMPKEVLTPRTLNCVNEFRNTPPAPAVAVASVKERMLAKIEIEKSAAPFALGKDAQTGEYRDFLKDLPTHPDTLPYDPKKERVQAPLLTQQIWRKRTLPPQLLSPRSLAAGSEHRQPTSESPTLPKLSKMPIEHEPTPYGFRPEQNPWAAPKHPVHPGFAKLKPVEEPMLSKQVWLRRTLPREMLQEVEESEVDTSTTSRVATAKSRKRLAELFKKLLDKHPNAAHAFTHALDQNNSGSLSLKELHSVLILHNVLIPMAELKGLMEEFDTSGDGTVDFSEFKKWTDQLLNKALGYELQHSFNTQ
jgi:Ca2+-binding EF-hand superfamily protein